MKICAFCGQGQVTKEHLWGKWLIKEMEEFRSPHDKYDRTEHFLQKKLPDNSTKTVRGFLSFNGTELHAKRKIACRKCNNEWMSQLEASAQKVVRSAIKCNPLTLEASTLNILTRWLALKAACFAFTIKSSDNDYQGVSPHFTEELYQIKAGETPPRYNIFICALRQPYQWGWHRLRYGLNSDDNNEFIFSFAGAIGALGFVVSNSPNADIISHLSDDEDIGHFKLLDARRLKYHQSNFTPPVADTLNLELAVNASMGFDEEFHYSSLRNIILE